MSKIPRKLLILWLVSVIFFAFQFILRISIGVLREDIMQRFNIDLITFGSIAGFYYLGYAGMQLPVGFLLDINFRLTTTVSILLSVMGTLAFVLFENWEFALMGRFLVGAGSAAGFLSSAKVVNSFPTKLRSSALGITVAIGLVGAVFGGKPLKILHNYIGYNNTFYLLSSIGAILGLIVLFLNSKEIKETQTISFNEIKKLFLNHKIILTCLCGGFMVGSMEGFADIWAIPFFEQIHNISEYDSIYATSFIFIGMCIGSPILSTLNVYIKSESVLIVTGIMTCLIFAIFFTFKNISLPKIILLNLILGIACAYQVIIFHLISSMVKHEINSIATALTNCIIMSFGHIFHTLITGMMQYGSSGSIYTTYLYSFSPIVVLCFISMLYFLYCRLIKLTA